MLCEFQTNDATGIRLLRDRLRIGPSGIATDPRVRAVRKGEQTIGWVFAHTDKEDLGEVERLALESELLKVEKWFETRSLPTIALVTPRRTK